MSSKSKWVAVLVVGGLFGVAFLAGFNTLLAHTNATEFCISCHEMEANVYKDYVETAHYSNASGVRAGCADCHVPKEYGPKLLAKVIAVKDVYHHLLGTIDTREKYLEHRMDMARRVWKKMYESDSRECNTCHSYDAMHWEKQSRKGKAQMKKAQRKGITCIECHQGVAHSLPLHYDFEEEMAKVGIDLKN